MVANLVGFVVGPSGVSWLKSVFLHAEGLPTLFGLLVTFYIGTMGGPTLSPGWAGAPLEKTNLVYFLGKKLDRTP
ncbi:hypothetical protein Hdeb2414_s0009g00315131 [Helianthus debilis subsp. tardiflorus]